jgi:hypothetical protein
VARGCGRKLSSHEAVHALKSRPKRHKSGSQFRRHTLLAHRSFQASEHRLESTTVGFQGHCREMRLVAHIFLRWSQSRGLRSRDAEGRQRKVVAGCPVHAVALGHEWRRWHMRVGLSAGGTDCSTTLTPLDARVVLQTKRWKDARTCTCSTAWTCWNKWCHKREIFSQKRARVLHTAVGEYNTAFRSPVHATRL